MMRNGASREIDLEISGLGIILYSPASAAHIVEGSNYLRAHYVEPTEVQRHIQNGTIVGFGTASPGNFSLRFLSGYPTDARLLQARFKLRLGIRCEGGKVCCRDLYDLICWQPECPPEQMIDVDDGIYHLTLCSDRPPSGRLGDGQIIDIYLAQLEEFPQLATEGIPTLCV